VETVEEIALAYLYCMQQTYATGSIVAVDGQRRAGLIATAT
jgi:hypothetical protein